MNLHSKYCSSIESVFEDVKKSLAYTLVKEYSFSASTHFIERLIERKIPVNQFNKMLFDVCENNRILFANEGKVIVEYLGTRFMFIVHHNVMNSFRRVVFMTAYETDKNKDTIYRSTNKVSYLRLG